MLYRRFLFLILLSSSIYSLSLTGQDALILTGKVTDHNSNQPLPAVHVVSVNRQIGTITNEDGRFSLMLASSVNPDSILFKSLGFEDLMISIKEVKSLTNRMIEMIPQQFVLDEILIEAQKIDVLKKVGKAVTLYQKNKRSTPHLASSFYREKAKFEGQYVMFTESLGYTVFKGDEMTSMNSGYSFFCDNTRKSNRKVAWTKLAVILPDGEQMSDVGPLTNSLFGSLGFLESYGPLSRKYYKSYFYHIDSVWMINQRQMISLHFNKGKDFGSMVISADSEQIQSIHYHWDQKKLTSGLPTRQSSEIQFIYYKDTPYLYSISSHACDDHYEWNGEYQLLTQRFGTFNLNHEDSWAFIYYTMFPMVNYDPMAWSIFTVTQDPDYKLITLHLAGNEAILEDQFKNHSGKPWNEDYRKLGWTGEELKRAPELLSRLKKQIMGL